MGEVRVWLSLNSMINETNKSIGLEFYANVALRQYKDYTSYVRGKSINYNPSRINYLLHLQPPNECSVQNRRNPTMNEERCEEMKNAFRQPGEDLAIVNGKPLSLNTKQIFLIPRAWASFIRDEAQKNLTLPCRDFICTPSTQDSPTFPNYQFFTEAHVVKYPKVKDFKMASQRASNVENSEGCEELITMVEVRFWSSLNSMMNETNKSIGLEFYANVALCQYKDYTSYVQGKSINYNPSRFNYLLHLQPPNECSVQNIRNIPMTEERCEEMKNAFCQSGEEWVIVNGKPLSLKTR
ncbi:hypothetical protein KIW84_035657 [Lathyrus oleraceus]|uniref:Putative plant transposon protein domain-containing protein n=1 Tax=Pisum sativum TaxID=3888 RepID=A0A9D4Y7B7_PEA|nr:hypothetical protein KIW84_035657 [Pisum sativum]